MSGRRTKIGLAIGAVAVAAAAAIAAVSISGASSGDRHDAGPTTTTPTTEPTTTTTTVPTTTTTAPTTTTTVDCHCLRMGSAGPQVQDLQQHLNDLGFWLGPVNGTYGRLTQQAVMAFQKANGLGRDGVAGAATLAAVPTATRPAPPHAEDGVDIDLGRQLLFVVQGGQSLWVINTSTGKSSTPTVAGDFHVYSQIDGMRHAPLGDLWRPKYFNGGDAIHGSPSIPGYAASHGCARVSNGAIDFLWSSGLLPVGTSVRVH
jgi:peptidoglycan hydrolase-like protein with peptidoglycan-binding domain